MFALSYICNALVVTACAKEKDSAFVTVRIYPVFDGKQLILDTENYTNEHGNLLTISLFRFYITHLKLHVTGTSDYVTPEGSHLIDAQDTTTCSFSFSVPLGTFDSVSFVTGVDSADNTSGANSGDLDPAKGMYWAWNSGYIMAKLEGNSAVCKTIHKAFEFHIGGYMPPYNAMRQVNLPLGETVTIENGKRSTININADAARWFAHGLDLSVTNSVLIPGRAACEIADNYSGMFSISGSTP